MTGVPKIKNSEWRPERAVPVADALESLLDHLEILYEDESVGLPRDPLPMSTGLPAMDRVLGGGAHLGTVVLLEANIAAQANALVCSIARHIECRTVLDAPSIMDAVRWILAGEADVPAVLLATGQMSEADWMSIVIALRPLAEKNLSFSSVQSLRGIANVAATNDVAMLLVRDADRLGPAIKVVPELARIAALRSVAIVASIAPFGDLPDWALAGVARVGVHTFNCGGKATLLRPDKVDLLSVAQVGIELLTGIVR